MKKQTQTSENQDMPNDEPISNTPNKIFQNIKKIREFKGVSIKEIADKLDLSFSGYARMERGEVSLTIERAQQIADILGVTISKLIDANVAENFISYQQQGGIQGGKIANVTNYNVPEEIIEGYKNQIKAKDELIMSLKEQIELYKGALEAKK
jgi:transcriptional regulator with XRE-family HTH domain